MSVLSAATNQPCIVKPSNTSGPSRNSGSALTTAASAGPKMKPAHANVLSLPVYSVRCAGDTATERYDCSTACWPPEPMPWSSRPSSTTDGAAACETSVYTKYAIAYETAPLPETTQHTSSVLRTPSWTLSWPKRSEPSASPTLYDETTIA